MKNIEAETDEVWFTGKSVVIQGRIVT